MEVENANCKLRVSECSDMEILPVERPLKVDCEINGLEHLVAELHRAFSGDHVNVQDVQKLMSAYVSNPKDWKRFAKFDRYRYTRNLVDSGNGAFNIMILCWGAGHASAIHDHADSHCFMKLLSGNLEEVRFDWPKNVVPEVLRKQNKSKNRKRNDTAENIDSDVSNSTTCQHTKYEKEDSNNNRHFESNDFQNGDGKQNGGCCNNLRSDDVESYDFESMVETGRTRLEVNDVCYINDALGLHRMENPSHVDSAVSLHLYCPPFDSCRVFDARTGKPADVKVTFTSVGGKRVRLAAENNAVSASKN